MKTRTWILIFAALFAALLALWFLLPGGGGQAAVWQDGRLLRVVDLSEDTEFTVTGPAGENRIVVKNGEIFVAEAQCPDQTCVRHGILKAGGTPIICLPNRLVIGWREADTEIDGVSGVAG